MVANAERKEYPISMRLPEADVAMIDRAATLRGRSRTVLLRRGARTVTAARRPPGRCLPRLTVRLSHQTGCLRPNDGR